MAELAEWTISKISMELGVDRRTLERVILEQGIEPQRIGDRSKFYRLKPIFEALKYGSDKLDLSQEKALESKERRRKLSRENDLAEGLAAPIELLRETIKKVAGQAASILDALPLNIKKRCPLLTSRDIEFIKKEIAKCRNAIAGMEI